MSKALRFINNIRSYGYDDWQAKRIIQTLSEEIKNWCKMNNCNANERSAIEQFIKYYEESLLSIDDMEKEE